MKNFWEIQKIIINLSDFIKIKSLKRSKWLKFLVCVSENNNSTVRNNFSCDEILQIVRNRNF